MGGWDLQAEDRVRRVRRRIAALLVYETVLTSAPGQAFEALLAALERGDGQACLQAYGAWFRSLATLQTTWITHGLTQLARADTVFARAVQETPLEDLPAPLVQAARQDLQTLQQVYQWPVEQLAAWVQARAELDQPLAIWSVDRQTAPLTLPPESDWGEALATLAAHYRRYGTGIFAQFQVFRWHQGQLLGIASPDPIQLPQLAGYELQKAALVQNTEFLLAGYPALHVLLYGSRGSGKSSLVKALVHAYGDRNLRLIEVAKADLQDLPEIVEEVRSRPQKFILFVDDLSFEEDDDAFKALKVVLEGSVTARPANVVVYATSNRRHLVREYFEDRPRPRDADEINHWDTVQEKLSFSDRFGLTLTFEPADQPTFLEIVRHLAAQRDLPISPADLDYRALQWATRHNGRSGRTARQFVDFLQAELAAAGDA